MSYHGTPLSTPLHHAPFGARQKTKTMSAKALFPLLAVLSAVIGMMLPVPGHRAAPTRSLIETIEIG